MQDHFTLQVEEVEDVMAPSMSDVAIGIGIGIGIGVVIGLT